MDEQNPIPFNPMTMRADHLGEAAEHLRTLFELRERGASEAEIAAAVDDARSALIRKVAA